MKTIVFTPRDPRAFRDSSIRALMSLIEVLVAEKGTKRARVDLAMIRASVVFPEPGGPQKIIDGIRSLSMALRRKRPSSRRSCRPTTSSSEPGRRRSGRGASVGVFCSKSGKRDMSNAECRIQNAELEAEPFCILHSTQQRKVQ